MVPEASHESILAVPAPFLPLLLNFHHLCLSDSNLLTILRIPYAISELAATQVLFPPLFGLMSPPL